jgi:tetratricopeptide (TPR) repeat protein
MVAGLLLSLLLTFSPLENDFQNINPIELSPEMKKFVDVHVNRGLPLIPRLQALVSAVFEKNELHFSYSSESRSAVETFNSRNGNCLSFTLLFIAMARYLDLDARFREVDVPPVFNKKGSFVTLSQHVNAVVFIGAKAYSVDVVPEAVSIEVVGNIVSDQRGFAHFFNNKGVDELGRGNYELADAYLKKALEIDPTTISVLINLGAARAQAGKLGEAEDYYNRALAIDRKHLAALNNLANIYERTGRTKEYLRLQKKVKEFRGKNPYYHFSLGLQASELGDYATAIIHYEKAIKLNPTDHNFYFAAARAYGKIGRKDRAIKRMRQAEEYASDPNKKLLYAQKLEVLKAANSSMNKQK